MPQAADAPRVPPPDELDATLAGIHQLVTANKWQRAAIVHAYCSPDQGARTDLGRNRPRFTFSEFADKGFAGLTRRHSVARYWHAWEAAIRAGRARPLEVGDVIVPPSDEFPPSVALVSGDRPAAAAEVVPLGERRTVRFIEPPDALPTAPPMRAEVHFHEPATPARPQHGQDGFRRRNNLWQLGVARAALRRLDLEVPGDEEYRARMREEADRLVAEAVAVRQHFGEPGIDSTTG